MTMLLEGLFKNDLMGLILPKISINEFEPKIDEHAIVLAFYVKNVDAAQDLSIFLEKSAITEILDTEVSQSIDETGFYTLYVEVSATITAKTIIDIINLTQHLCPNDNWMFSAYKLSKSYPVTEKLLTMYMSSKIIEK